MNNALDGKSKYGKKVTIIGGCVKTAQPFLLPILLFMRFPHVLREPFNVPDIR